MNSITFHNKHLHHQCNHFNFNHNNHNNNHNNHNHMQNKCQHKCQRKCQHNFSRDLNLSTHKPKPDANMPTETDKFKTKLCTHFMATGKCFYGNKCHYAHGMQQLRRTAQYGPIIHPRHKTILCQNQFTHGSCKFGSSCMFIHKEDPEFKTLQEHMLQHQNLLKSCNQASSHRYDNDEVHLSNSLSEPEPTPVQQANSKHEHVASVRSLFTPLKNMKNPMVNNENYEATQPTNTNISSETTPGCCTSLSYDDRRIAAAKVWGVLTPQVSVWEQRLHGGQRFRGCVNKTNNYSTPPGF